MKLDALRIVGNGPGGMVEPVTDQLTITFNPTIERLPMRGEIQVSNWKHAGLQTYCRPFIVAAPSFGLASRRQFEELLRLSAMTLKPLLGCFPSSGLAAIHSGLQLAERVSVYRIPLKPSFVRAAGMPPRKPLACAFHNWLGERRIALSLLREHSPERLLWEPFPLESGTDCGEPTDCNPIRLLTDLFSRGSSVQESEFTGTLERLARVDRSTWFRNADGANLTALERYFFLSLNNSDTPNWWLFNNRVSSSVDEILGKLMVCQLDLMGY